MMETPFFIHHVGQWRFALFRIPHADGGFQGFADVHDGYDKLCRISLATSFQSQNALGAALSEKCLAWVKDWDARRLVAAGPDSDHSSLQL